MGLSKASCGVSMLQLFIVVCLVFQCYANKLDADLNTTLIVDASDASGRPIPHTLFGLFFEEINHAGVGGLWAELVSNRGFEAGGLNTPSNIDPWSIIGNQSSINVETDRTSCFDRNKVALRLEVLCDSKGDNICPADGVGVYNPGFWGMNIEQGKKYKVVCYVRSTRSIDLAVSLTGSNGVGILASTVITTHKPEEPHCYLGFLFLHLKSFSPSFGFLAKLFVGISRTVFPERLPKDDNLPPIDVFICTADPTKEPTLDVMNTVLSAMALDYPTQKLHVYVSDDGGLRVAWKFSKWWLPFCRRYRIKCRCPKAYFSASQNDDDGDFAGNNEFIADKKIIKEKYEAFKEDIAGGKKSPLWKYYWHDKSESSIYG